MSDHEPPSDSDDGHPGGPDDEIVTDPTVDDDETWEEHVEIVDGEGYARAPNEIHCLDSTAAERVVQLVRDRGGVARIEVFTATGEFAVASDVIDVDLDTDELRDAGHAVEVSYMLFADGAAPSTPACGCDCCCASAPAANPMYASPMYASPMYASPMYASAYRRSGKRPTTARPADEPPRRGPTAPAGGELFVFDTGLARPALLPAFLQGRVENEGTADDVDPPGPPDVHHPPQYEYLFPAAGHGTFIAGIVEQLIPGRTMRVDRVLHSTGFGKMGRIANVITHRAEKMNEFSVVNLSFSGYSRRGEEMRSLKKALRAVHRRRAVVVASAGNDGTCRETLPASARHVISVGAITPFGPAPFSNHGAWVRACAPGADLVSSFYTDIDGPLAPSMPGQPDPDRFWGWARWSGTSFSAPVVASALLRHIALTPGTARDAVAWVIDRPGLFRLPGLGTVINASPAQPV